MFRKISFSISTFILLLFITACSQTSSGKEKKTTLTISAAASLQDAMKDIQTVYEKNHPHTTLTFNFAGSGTLQQQIEQGAPVDLFFSASKENFIPLLKSNLIEKSHHTTIIGNQLVLIVPKSTNLSVTNFDQLTATNVSKIAIGTPQSVPAGTYAKEALQSMNLWKSLENKFVYAKDVRQVLTYVESGNVAAGIVYKTDAIFSKKVTIASTAGDQTHQPITYPVGVIHTSKHQKEAKLFYQYLQSKTSLSIFKKYGFNVVLH